MPDRLGQLRLSEGAQPYQRQLCRDAVPTLPLRLIDSALDAALYAVIDSVIFRERSPLANRVLGAGVEPAHLAAPEPKSGVSAIPPPEQNL